MLQDTKVKQLQVIVAEEAPRFSEEFVSMVQDRVYETLRAYLEKTKAHAAALQLLDDLIILSTPRCEASLWVYDQILSETIGQSSYHVQALGGSFLNK